MKDHYFYNALRKTIIQFLDLFNDITIARYATDGEILKYVSVPVKFAPKTRGYYFQEKETATGEIIRDKVLPIIGINMTGLEYASDRAVNKNSNITSRRTQNDISRFLNPVPYDISFEVKIAAQYVIDITQIIENILPFFDPTAFIRITIPELDIIDSSEEGAANLDLKVIYEGSSPEMQVEIDEANFRVLEWTLTFKVEGFMFKPLKTEGVVKKVVNKIYTNETSWVLRNSTTQGASGIGNDAVEILTLPTSGVKYDEEARILYKYELYEKFEE
jgi:hypothetical protein